MDTTPWGSGYLSAKGGKSSRSSEGHLLIAIRLCSLYVIHLGIEAAPTVTAASSAACGLLLAFLAMLVSLGQGMHSLRYGPVGAGGVALAGSFILLGGAMKEIGFARAVLGSLIGSTLLPSFLGFISRQTIASTISIFVCLAALHFLGTSVTCADPPCLEGHHPVLRALSAGALAALQALIVSRANSAMPSKVRARMEATASLGIAAAFAGLLSGASLLLSPHRGGSPAGHQAGYGWVLGFGVQAAGLLAVAVGQASESARAARAGPAAVLIEAGTSVLVAIVLEAAGYGIGPGFWNFLVAGCLVAVASWSRWRGRSSIERLLPGSLSGLRSAATNTKMEVLQDLFDTLQKAKSSKASVPQSASTSFLASLVSGADKIGGGGNGKQARLLTFLSINTGLMFVEFGYGALNNNLGLLSDGCHMLFDNASLAIGLYAAHMATLPPDGTFTFGYGRVESLAGFANGVLLIFVALEITLESIERMMEPPELSTNGLLVVSILGLLVNVIGLVCCHEAHDHGHHHHHHGDGDGSDSDSDDSDCHEIHDHNMRAVFLHILADTLGSVSVIISVLCIQYLGWNWADPIASLFISICTMASVVPLLQQTAEVLLLRMPRSKAKALEASRKRLEHVPGLVGVLSSRFWCHTTDTVCGALQLGVAPGTDKQAVLQQARGVYERAKLAHLAVEVTEVLGHSAMAHSAQPTTPPVGFSSSGMKQR